MKAFNNGVQFAWNSSSIKLSEECLRKYELKMIQGWVPRAQSVHLRFGSLYATALEHFHKRLSEGEDRESALREIVREALIETWQDDAPEAFLHPAKTRENLIRTIVWYVDHFADDNCTVLLAADGTPAVEKSFLIEVDNSNMFCGHLDRLVEYAGDNYVMDQKAQPLSTCILAPQGWRPLGDLQVGDLVAGYNGTFTSITHIFDKGLTPVYRLSFNDGTSVKCAEQHLWTVATQVNPTWKTVELEQLLHSPSWKKFHIPLCKPIQHEESNLPLHPYVLGVLLGDGYLGAKSTPQLSTGKQGLAKKTASLLPKGDSLRKSYAANYTWNINGGNTLKALKELGLHGHRSGTKFIPREYMFCSEEQRRDLLQGLLDTDGSWNGKSRIYDTTSLQLAEQICQLVRSLGGTARYRNRHDTAYRLSLRMPEWPTSIGKRYITAIERVPDEPTRCIKVEAEDGLYITENYIVTHNTTGHNITPRYYEQFRPDTQMSMYSFAGKIMLGSPIKGVIIDAAQIAVGFTRFERGFTYRTEDELNEWYDGAMYHIEAAQRATREQHFPMNTSSCGNYGGCEFRHICGMSPASRERFLKADFEKGKILDPLERR